MSDQDQCMPMVDQSKLSQTQSLVDQYAQLDLATLLQNKLITIEYNIQQNLIEVKLNSDITFLINGEMEIVTDGKPLCLDSIDSKIFLNSRNGLSLRKNPKYIEELKKELEEQQKKIEEYKQRENLLISIVSKLEKEVLGSTVLEDTTKLAEIL